MSSLALRDVGKSFGTTPILKNVTLDVAGGERFVLLGASGSGKTTLLRIVAGLEQPDAGDVRLGDASVTRVPPEKRDVGLVFQRPLLFPHLSVAGNLAFGPKLRGEAKADIDRKVAEMLDLVNLAGFQDRRPHQLSGGQESRVALARALITSPKVLLLDEPFSALDTTLRTEMRAVVKDLQTRLGTTIVLVTHDLDDALALGQRLGLLHGGRLLQVGEPRSFYDAPATLDVARYMGGANFLGGEQEGREVRTSLGILTANVERRGRVVVTIRPEAVRGGPGAHNTFEGTVIRAEYGGTFVRHDLRVEGATLVWHAPPHETHAPGERVTVHVPVTGCWTVPAESAEVPM